MSDYLNIITWLYNKTLYPLKILLRKSIQHYLQSILARKVQPESNKAFTPNIHFSGNTEVEEQVK